jgi:8-oxo-dGTP diphosphatase
MSEPYRPIVATLGYILSPDGKETLLIHRNAREDDEHLGKYNGLGGKMHPEEDVMTCMTREIREEAGIEVTGIRLRGTVNWTGFGRNGEDWLGFLFLVTSFTGTPFEENPEGTLAWHRLTEIYVLPMWEGDRHFLPLVFDENSLPFHGVMPYRDGRPVSWSYVRA